MISVEEAINNFYKEKSKYESLLEKDKKSIIKNKDLSWKEKRLEYKKLKPKCINCKRPVGSIFTITHDSNKSDEPRILRATCGDKVNPCNFNININPGSYYNIVTDLKKEEAELKKYKLKIIDEKNKLLFGYVSTEDAVNNFEEIKNDITGSSQLLELYYKEYNNVFDNEEKKSELKQLLTSSYLFINQIKNARNIKSCTAKKFRIFAYVIIKEYLVYIF
jgi:transposase-like protein